MTVVCGYIRVSVTARQCTTLKRQSNTTGNVSDKMFPVSYMCEIWPLMSDISSPKCQGDISCCMPHQDNRLSVYKECK